MKKYFTKKTSGGYTIIETMIAVSLFLIIVVAGVGALLNANLVHNKSADMRSIMDNLTFIMEDISRHVRTGYNYRCYFNDEIYGYGNESWNGDQANTPVLNEPRFCYRGGALAFEEAYGTPADLSGPHTDDQWVYKIEAPNIDEPFNIWKSSDGGQTFTRLNDAAVSINPNSFFAVLGPNPYAYLGGDFFQPPLVRIVLNGEIHYKDIVTPFSLQTTVSQRVLDVTP